MFSKTCEHNNKVTIYIEQLSKLYTNIFSRKIAGTFNLQITKTLKLIKLILLKNNFKIVKDIFLNCSIKTISLEIKSPFFFFVI